MKSNKYGLVIFIGFIVIISILLFDLLNGDNLIYEGLFDKHYDLPFWTILEFFTVVSSVLIAYTAILQSNKNLTKQLEIEQTPYVVCNAPISAEASNDHARNSLKLKNIGRGMACNISVGIIIKNKTERFTKDDQPHSVDLGPQDNSASWEIKEELINKLSEETKKGDSTEEEVLQFLVEIQYFDQLGAQYITTTTFQKVGNHYKVMLNVQEKITK